MTLHVRSPVATTRVRTPQSLAFEAAWREARGNGLVPNRACMPLRPFKRMLPDIVLMDLHDAEAMRSVIRIVGDNVGARVQRNIVGENHFSFLPEARRADAARVLNAVVNHPCGLWQVTAAHYERGFARCYEITTLPIHNEGGLPQIMLRTEACPGQVLHVPKDVAVLALDDSRDVAFFDIGAGVPDWSPKA